MQAKFPITWILAADGGSMRIWECRDWQDKPREVPEFAADSLAAHGFAHDLKSDKPGRAFASSGDQRAAIEPRNDPHAVAKRDFAELAAETVGAAFAQGRFERLIITAAPKTLGDLRKCLPAALRDAVMAEFDKDMVKSGAAEISALVDPVLHPLKG